MTNELTVVEQNDLVQYEVVIDRGIKSFIEVGAALMAIRESRLYRQDFSTFEDYCQERWGLGRNFINRQIAAIHVVENLVTVVTKNNEVNGASFPLPPTERHARPLTKLDPEDQPVVWQRAVETAPNGKVTAAHVAATVEAYLAPALPPITPGIVTFDSNEWYTPVEYIEAARRVMGSIDLDPASNDEAQQFIKAEHYYTKANDGLAQTWRGNVWLNPPYADPLPWVSKLIDSFAAGTVTAGILLVNTTNSPQWARLLWHSPHRVCLLNRRVNFWRPDRTDTRGTAQDQMIWYLGNNIEQFGEVFSVYGAIR